MSEIHIKMLAAFLNNFVISCIDEVNHIGLTPSVDNLSLVLYTDDMKEELKLRLSKIKIYIKDVQFIISFFLSLYEDFEKTHPIYDMKDMILYLYEGDNQDKLCECLRLRKAQIDFFPVYEQSD